MKLHIFLLEDETGFYPRSQLLEVLAPHDVTLATTCEEAKKLYKGNYDLVLLDHDFIGRFDDSKNPNTGFQFLKWMLEKYGKMKKPQVILHSQNPTGRKNMKDLLNDYGWEADECPFGPDYIKLLRKLV